VEGTLKLAGSIIADRNSNARNERDQEK
jgi:hypothetical protein